MQRYFAAFPQVAAWMEEAEAAGRRTGRARTPFGRIRVLGQEGTAAPTLSRNAPIQGAGADMTKLALAAVGRRLVARFPHHGRPPGFEDDGLVLVVHDELVAEVPEEDAEEAAALVRDGMLEAAREVLGDVPAAVDVAVRSRWGQEEPAAVAAGG
jgi:DNA polymerase I